MGRFFANLDNASQHSSRVQVLDEEQIEKWSLVFSAREQLRFSTNGVEKPQQYVMPRSRQAYVDYSLEIKPGSFGLLVPGEEWDYAFQTVGNPVTDDNFLFSSQSIHGLDGRDKVEYEIVSDRPKT